MTDPIQNLDNTQKIALVTGGNRGIGFEIVRQLAQKGLIVLLGARSLTDAEHAAAKITTDDMQVMPLKLDVTSATDIENVSQWIEQKFGYLDILINNAGVHLAKDTDFTIDAEILRQTYEVNTIAPFILSQKFLPLLQKSKNGRIVHQSSMTASMEMMGCGEWDEFICPAYNLSKAALNMMTVIMARQLHNTPIKVNAAHPGWVRTRIGGEDADLSPHEGAKTAIRLALLPEDGPTGGFFFGDKQLPW
jgi:NAD(P)-dependent dehydrogenase (short-subunit alcohol dehydrogenase family)